MPGLASNDLLDRFKVKYSVYLPFYVIYLLFIHNSMYGEMTSRNHLSFSRGHLVSSAEDKLHVRQHFARLS